MGMRTPEELVTELRRIQREVALWEDALLWADAESDKAEKEFTVVYQALYYASQHVASTIFELETVQGEADFEISHRIS